MAATETTNNQVNKMQNVLENKIDEYFPTKTVKLSNKDKLWIDAELKKLDRQKKRIYYKQGKSKKYLELKNLFDSKYKKAAAEYLEENVRKLKESDPGKAYATLNRMGAQPGDNLDDGSFSLLEHLEENLTSYQSVERITEHFSSISQEYPALNVQTLPQNVQNKLQSRLSAHVPYVSKYQVENMIRKAKKTKSGVPGDIPKQLCKEFGPELGAPLSLIYNNIIQSGLWPDAWKVEFGLPLQKKPNPINED